MDICHCAHPAPQQNEQGVSYCLNCRLLYDEAEWRQDPRVMRAKRNARQFTKEQQDIIDSIKREAVQPDS